MLEQLLYSYPPETKTLEPLHEEIGKNSYFLTFQNISHRNQTTDSLESDVYSRKSVTLNILIQYFTKQKFFKLPTKRDVFEKENFAYLHHSHPPSSLLMAPNKLATNFE